MFFEELSSTSSGAQKTTLKTYLASAFSSVARLLCSCGKNKKFFRKAFRISKFYGGVKKFFNSFLYVLHCTGTSKKKEEKSPTAYFKLI